LATPVRDQAAISSDFDTFLKMLTAQITNQDPLNPINSEQFAVQLATFSGVEQQVRTNQLLESMISGLGQGDFGQMAAWVGMEARATMPTMYEGEPLSVTPPYPAAGNRHELVALDANGNEIWRGRYFPGTGNVTWDGIRTDGTTAPDGIYGFQLESFEDDRLVATGAAQTYGQVQEVRMDWGGTIIVFAGGVERYADEISALRQGIDA
jgi:flagellar basal-body rod modification protein FlgD